MYKEASIELTEHEPTQDNVERQKEKPGCLYLSLFRSLTSTADITHERKKKVGHSTIRTWVSHISGN